MVGKLKMKGVRQIDKGFRFHPAADGEKLNEPQKNQTALGSSKNLNLKKLKIQSFKRPAEKQKLNQTRTTERLLQKL